MILDQFELSKEEVAILRAAGLDNNDTTAILTLQQYKFRTEEEILNVLKKELSDKHFVTFEEVSSNALQYDHENDVFYFISGTTTVYVCSGLTQPEEITLDFLSTSMFVVYQFVTPYCALLLKQKVLGQPLPEVQPDVLFSRILLEGLRLKATDVHFEVTHDMNGVHYPVKYRKNRKLLEMEGFELTRAQNTSIITSLIERRTGASSLDVTDASGVVAGVYQLFDSPDLYLRVSCDSVYDGIHCVIRLQKASTFNFDIPALGFQGKVQQVLYNTIEKQSGVTFITGAMGSGKNTTGFAMLKHLESLPVKIVSYESPIENLMPFPQVDFMDDHNTLFNAISLAKKQDVNYAYINEIPNKNVALAMRDLVNSSVHVLTTMHMDRVWHLPYKLKEYYGEEFKDVISQINLVINQKMFSVSCPHCKMRRLTSEVTDTRIRDLLTRNSISDFYISDGCTRCDFTGVLSGAVQPYVEFIVLTDDIKSELLACSEAYQMEAIIKKYVKEAGDTLEADMLHGVVNGRLNVNDFKSIL